MIIEADKLISDISSEQFHELESKINRCSCATMPIMTIEYSAVDNITAINITCPSCKKTTRLEATPGRYSDIRIAISRWNFKSF